MANPSFFGLSPQETALALEQERMQQLPQNKPYFAGDINFAVANQNLRELGPRVRASLQERSFKPLIEGGLGGFRDPRMQRSLLLDEARQEVANSGVDIASDPMSYYDSAFKALMKRGLVNEANQVRSTAIDEFQKLRTNATQPTSRYEMKDGFVVDKLTGAVTRVEGYQGKSTGKPSYDYLMGPEGDVIQVVMGSQEAAAALARGYVPWSKPDKPTEPKEDTFAREAGKTAVEAVTVLRNNALSAPKFASTANEIESMLASGAITGPGANLKLAFARMVGFAGGDTEAITASENMFKQLASTTLAAIPSAGLGTGQGFTDKDLKFLERAVSGDISLTPESLRRVAEYNRKLATTSVKAFEDYYSGLPKDRQDVLKSFGLTPINLPDMPRAVTSEDLSQTPSNWPGTSNQWSLLTPEEKSRFLQLDNPKAKK